MEMLCECFLQDYQLPYSLKNNQKTTDFFRFSQNTIASVKKTVILTWKVIIQAILW